jgi:hypothetical protein
MLDRQSCHRITEHLPLKPGECLRILGYLVAGHSVAKTATAIMPSRTSVDTIDRTVLARWRRESGARYTHESDMA